MAAVLLIVVTPRLREVFVVREAGAREELWAEVKAGTFSGTAFVAPEGQTFEDWARRKARGLTKGKADRLVPAEPPSSVFGGDVRAVEALDAPGARRTYLRLDAPTGTSKVGDIAVQRKAPKEPQEGPESCRIVGFERLPPKARMDWQEFWIAEMEREGRTSRDPAIVQAGRDSNYDPSQDATASEEETKFGISGEGHVAALVGGKHPFFYDDMWVDGATNEAAKVQALGLLGIAGLDVRRLMPPPNPRFLQGNMVPPGMPPPRRR